jgi:hypothetical protein
MNITPAKVFESLVLYIILHAIIWILLLVTRPITKQLKKESDYLIAHHVRQDHSGRFTHCIEPVCKHTRPTVQLQGQQVASILTDSLL